MRRWVYVILLVLSLSFMVACDGGGSSREERAADACEDAVDNLDDCNPEEFDIPEEFEGLDAVINFRCDELEDEFDDAINDCFDELRDFYDCVADIDECDGEEFAECLIEEADLTRCN